MQAVLILTEGVTVTSGNNPKLIGNMNGGTSTKVTWTIVFHKNDTHTLQVHVSGYDSNGNPCSASKSTTVIVNGDFPPMVPFELIVVIGILSILVLAGALVLWKRRQVELANEFKYS